MESSYHVCAPLLSIGQQARQRPLFIDAAGRPTRADEAASAPRSATGAELIHRIALLSRALSACGLDGLQRPLAPVGSVVVLVAQTGAVMMEAMLACLDAGCILCPVNWRWSVTELAEALQRLSPALVLHDVTCAALALQAVAEAGRDLQAQRQQQQQHAGSNGPYHATAAKMVPPLCLIDHWCPATGSRGALWGGCSTTASATAATGAPASSSGSSRSTGACPLTTSRLISFAAGALPSSTPPPPPSPQLQLLAPACGTALLVFTSGTTAAPKGVQLSHAAFHAQSMVKLALVGYCPADTYLHTAPLFHIGGLSSAFAALMAGCVQVFMPRFDAEAALAAILHHRVSVFIAVPTMLQDLAAAAAATAAAVTGAAGPERLPAGAEAVAPGPLGCVRRILVGAGGTAPKLQDAVSRTFPAAHLLSAYGMTEACSSMTFRHMRGPAHPASTNAGGWQQQPQQLQLWAPPGSNNSSKPVGGLTQPDAAMAGAVCVGWPAPGVQIRVVRTEAADQPHQAHTQGAQTFQQVANSSCTSSYGGTASGRQVPPRTLQGQPPRQQGTAGDQEGAAAGETCGPHELGEVQTRGPHTLLRYWRDDDATAKALTTDGWLRTGDLGYLAADGGLWLLGRAKDMIKSGGENVFAPQVEAVLCAHPAVAAAAVVGLPHERLGEQVSALVVLRGGWKFLGPSVASPSSGSASSSAAATTAPAGAPGSCSEPAAAAQQTSLQDLQDFCRRQGLAGFRLPRLAAAQWQPLPLNGSGKVAKPVVRAVLQSVTGVGMSRL